MGVGHTSAPLLPISAFYLLIALSLNVLVLHSELRTPHSELSLIPPSPYHPITLSPFPPTPLYYFLILLPAG
jgi:hypothetical protein